jgi:hypothetical protein
MATNLAMLQNLLTPLLTSAKGLRHISLLQGAKAYGAHVGGMKVPGREREPRVEHPNFYWLQEDWLRARRATASWVLTIWRPPLIVGHAFGAPMNLLAVIGVYGALAQAQSRAFCWPGGPGRPLDVVDARLLASAFAWAAGVDGIPAVASQDQTFNIANGDVFVAPDLWPRLARCFGLELGPAEPQLLQQTLPVQAEIWSELVRRHDLCAPGLMEFVGDSLIYADMFFGSGRRAEQTKPLPSSLLSTIKLRQAGFAECMDTEDMFVDWLAQLQRARILPPPTAALD